MDLRIAKTKARLTAALSAIAGRKPIDNITVCELCKEAHVNRTTFYKYYSTPRDLIQESLNLLMSDVLKRIQEDREKNPVVDPYPTILHGCKLFLSDVALTRDLVYNISPILEILEMFFTNLPDLTPEQLHMMMFVSGGCASYLRYWLINEPERTAEEIAAEINQYVKMMVNSK